MVEMAIFNVQRAITQELGKPKLWFMHSACRLIVLYSCVKFPENISKGIRVMEPTQISKMLMDGWQTDTQNFEGYNIIPHHIFCGRA